MEKNLEVLAMTGEYIPRNFSSAHKNFSSQVIASSDDVEGFKYTDE